ncbi:MAG: hypothetical protein JNJ73_17435 [Hyphomonadaceae bacterium]|nr:hypothetical protein [Hyphomonadaceae bacterium]
MNRLSLAAASIALVAFLSCSPVAAQSVTRGGAYTNGAGGVTAGARRDAVGPFGGRTAGEGGVVTNGVGGGAAGSRGCGRDAAGARGCRSGATAWDRNGNVAHEGDAVFAGPFGGAGSASGSFTRDSSGEINGNRSGEYTIGDRTYRAETSVQTGQGIDRTITCSGAACRN